MQVYDALQRAVDGKTRLSEDERMNRRTSEQRAASSVQRATCVEQRAVSNGATLRGYQTDWIDQTRQTPPIAVETALKQHQRSTHVDFRPVTQHT